MQRGEREKRIEYTEEKRVRMGKGKKETAEEYRQAWKGVRAIKEEGERGRETVKEGGVG